MEVLWVSLTLTVTFPYLRLVPTGLRSLKWYASKLVMRLSARRLKSYLLLPLRMGWP